ncbi:uncharacterized protein LOC121414923 [Lytechinus variegatus]|uniref:uncharacterized protein LOC121414923 n=1 Tax=Lytechinus variegatus TaxID=7654 RepID=UPI001BB127B5|nr:uncharacterized protein LOC121414923 [Lytechinus variegatus]
MMQTIEDVRRLTMSDMNGRPLGRTDTHYRSVVRNHSIPMSRSLPVNPPRFEKPRDDLWRSSQSLTGRASIMTYNHKQYPSASAALSDYISDYESQNSSQDSQSQPSYRRTVSDLLLPKSSLQKTVQRSLETGDQDTKDEFHRFNIRKLIDDSYEQILRADLEQGKASTIVATAKHLGSESSLTIGESTPNGKEFSDTISEISSSTDALLLANPYMVKFSQRGRTSDQGAASSLRRSRSIDSARLSASSSYARQRHIKSLGRLNETRQQTKSSSSQLSGQRPQVSLDSSNVLRMSHGVPSPKHSVYDKRQETRRTVSSRSDGRPIPAWVSDLDSSAMSKKRLDTLYTDTLLSADSSGTIHLDSMKQSQMNGTSTSLPRSDLMMHTLSSQGHLEDRAMSVMSAARPPPSWVEELDTTVDSLSGSLRMLGKKMEGRYTRDHRVNHRVVINNSHKNGLSGEVSRPASLQSDLKQHKVTSKHTASEMRYSKGGNMDRNIIKDRTSSDVAFTKERTINQRLHRTQSASTNDLIKESPHCDTTNAPSSHAINHRLHLLRQSKGKPQASHKDKSSRTSTLRSSTHTNLPFARSPRQGHLPPPSYFVSESDPQQSTKNTQLDISTTTDSLIYSSPFGLDRDMPFPDLSVLPPAYGESHKLSPVQSKGLDRTLKEEELASSLSSLSSITLDTDSLMNEKASRTPLIADHVSESTVGDTARTNAMLRRANRIVENTQASLNDSSLLEEQAHTARSSDTEELLAGDQELMSRVQTRLKAEGGAFRDPTTQEMLDHFLEDCILSGKESPDISEERISEGPLESLKNMLFKLQDMASLHDVESGGETKLHQHREPSSERSKKLHDITRHSATPSGGTRHLASSKKQPTPSTMPSSSSPSVLRGAREKDTTFSSTSSQNRIKNVSFQSQKKFEEEPGGQSLQRAMKHLSRLKTLVAVETASPMASSVGGVSSL